MTCFRPTISPFYDGYILRSAVTLNVIPGAARSGTRDPTRVPERHPDSNGGQLPERTNVTLRIIRVTL